MKDDKNEYVGVDALGTAKFFIHFGEKAKANQILDMVLPLCTTMEQLDEIGYAYTKNRNFKKGLEVALKQLPKAKDPTQMWDARVNVIRSCLNANMPDEAYRYIKANKALKPTDQQTLADEAYALFLLNRKDEGEKILRAIVAKPDTQDIFERCTFNLGSYDLRNGNFKLGMRNFLLSGRKFKIWEEYKMENEFWDGAVLPGKTVVLMAEGGIGDEIINVRFMKHVASLGMTPVWYSTRKDLADVFRRCGFTVVTSMHEIKKDWLWTYGMLSPVYLNVDEDKLWDGPYLQPKVVSTPGKKKIGLKVAGNPFYDHDLARQLPLEEVLAAIPEDYEIYSFHKDEPFDHPRVINWMTDETTWDDTLNKISEMECMISSCTSLVHAAGAMGKKTFVLVPILKYYLWSNDKLHSPWYGDNMHVLHQIKQHKWDEPLAILTDFLSKPND